MNYQKGEGLISNILAIAGFIILIVIIIWGAFHFLSLASAGFSSLISRTGGNTLQVTAPKTVASGAVLDISWKYTAPEGTGNFALLYQCREGFQFRMPIASTTTAIPCGTPFTITNKDGRTARLLPLLSTQENQDVPFSIIYMTTGTTTGATVAKTQGNATVTVTKGETTTTTTSTGTGTKTVTDTKTAPTVTTKQPSVQPTTPKPVTPADLVVRIISVGVIDPITGAITNRAPQYPHDVVAVTFDIKNQGGSSSGGYYFTAQLPTNPVTPYTSPLQNPLGPGDHVENTLRFNQSAGGTFSVSVDPTNVVRESNENNNYLSEMISAATYPQYPYGYQQPYYY